MRKHLRSWRSVAAAVCASAAVATLGLSGVATKAPAAWRSDLARATLDAKQAGKDLLVEFTVRDAEGNLPPLDHSVFDNPSFLRGIGAGFVPVRLAAATGGAACGPEVAVVELAQRLGVEQIPSLILMDGEGRPYAAVESRSESVRAQLADVARAADQRRQRDEAFALAARSAGLERARQLDAALGHVGRFAVTGYESLVEEVVTLDADNAAGLREKYAGPLAERRIDRAVQAMVYPLIDRADLRGALRAVDEIVADVRPPPHHRQTLTAFKGQILHTMGCEAEARRVLSEALAIDPVGASAERVRAAIERLGE